MTPEQIGIVIADRFLVGEPPGYVGRDCLALHIASAINQERERCAKIAEETEWRLVERKTLAGLTCAIAAAIRKGE